MYRRVNDGVKLLTGADGRFTETGLAREKSESFFRTLPESDQNITNQGVNHFQKSNKKKS